MQDTFLNTTQTKEIEQLKNIKYPKITLNQYFKNVELEQYFLFHVRGESALLNPPFNVNFKHMNVK